MDAAIEAKLKMVMAVLIGLWAALLATGCNDNGYQTFEKSTVCYWTLGG
jgi:hypothetical protein